MLSLLILFILSLIALWILTMYGVWRANNEAASEHGVAEALAPTYKKSARLIRRGWFALLRVLNLLRSGLEKVVTKIFFSIFPNAKKAFEKKDELTGLEHGPSSYFLMSVSEYKEELQKEPSIPSGKKIRRNRKNV